MCTFVIFLTLAKSVKSTAIEKYYEILKYHGYIFHLINNENKNRFNFYYLMMNLLFMENSR